MPASTFAAEWERCAGWIQAALDRNGNKDTLDSVRAKVLAGDAQFWPMPQAAGVTRIVQHETCREIVLWLAGGDMDDVLRLQPIVEEFGRSYGCTRSVIYGRKGWARMLPDYTQSAVVLCKEI